MADVNVNANPYGYSDDEVKVSPFVFGLNAGVTYLKKFEFTPTGGAGGKDQEALDIIFEINGTEKSYRMFPMTKAFGKNGEEITDPSKPEFKKAMQDWTSRVTHILHCFIPKDSIQAGMNVPALVNAAPKDQFKVYCQIAASLLPKDFSTKPLDIFLQYQTKISSGQSRTYLEVPKNMFNNKWICPAQAGTWVEKRAERYDDKTAKALWYENEKGEVHPFVKNGYFLNSKAATQQTDGSSSSSTNTQAADAQISGQVTTPPTSGTGQLW